MRICLINMPWAQLNLPSIGLTQLKGALDQEFGKLVKTEVHNLNLRFAEFFGPHSYAFVAKDALASHCNYGEWYFRQAAFPNLPDNTEAFFQHYRLGWNDSSEGAWPAFPQELRMYALGLAKRRPRLGEFMDQLIQEYRLDQADLIGFSSLFNQNVPILAMARHIRLANPAATIVVGGPNCESPMGEELLRQFPVLDYAFSGKALVSFPEFVAAFRRGDTAACLDIDGVFSRANLDRIHYQSRNVPGQGRVPISHPGLQSKRPPEGKIDTLGQDISLQQTIDLDYDQYLVESKSILEKTGGTPYLLFETSRGCWWGEKAHCTFCGLNGRTMEFAEVPGPTASDYLKDFFRKYTPLVKDFGATDSIMPKGIIESTFSELELPEDINIFYEVKADLRANSLEQMAKARIKKIQPGIESIDSSILKLMRKGATGTSNVAFLREASRFGIHCVWNLLIGFPGETETPYLHYLEHFPYLHHLTPPRAIYIVRFDRYSPYFTEQADFGLHLRPNDYYRFIYPEMEESARYQLAYFFMDQKQGAPYQDLPRKWYPQLFEQVQAWEKRFQVKDDLLPPQLYLLPETNEVYDSRSGKIDMHPLSPSQQVLLQILDRPRSKGKLQNLYQGAGHSRFDADLTYLMERRLIFHEGRQTFVSLVLDRESHPLRKDLDVFQ